MTHIAYIGLGSNLGDREAGLRETLRRLHRQAGALEAVSSFYETEPWGFADQPRFLNAACGLHTALSPGELLVTLKAVESAMGREPTFQYGPRVIDLDILLYDNLTVDTPDLQIPHAHMHERAFVLVPLAEIAPGAWHPVWGMTVEQMMKRLPA